MEAGASQRPRVGRATRERHWRFADAPGLRDTARLLTAGVAIGVAARSDRASRAVSETLEATALGRIVPRLSPAGDPASRAVARALRSVALRRIPLEERHWIARIEARRRELATDPALTEPVFMEGPAPRDSRWPEILSPVAVSRACGVISTSRLWGVLLMRLVRELAPSSCVELGTGFGISAAYQAASLELNGAGRLTTLEGAAQWATIATDGATALGLHRMQVRVGPLADTLDSVLSETGLVDFAYVDADHTEEATLSYFSTLLPRLSNGAVVVFDDIAFDAEMWRAWLKIRSHERVSEAVSLGRLGIVLIAPLGG